MHAEDVWASLQRGRFVGSAAHHDGGDDDCHYHPAGTDHPHPHRAHSLVGTVPVRTSQGSDVKVPKALRRELPELLWLMQMGLVLFWVHDSSPDQRRTHDPGAPA